MIFGDKQIWSSTSDNALSKLTSFGGIAVIDLDEQSG